jgi:hypothetical protein
MHRVYAPGTYAPDCDVGCLALSRYKDQKCRKSDKSSDMLADVYTPEPPTGGAAAGEAGMR